MHSYTFAYFFPFLYSVSPSEQGKSPLSVIIPILSPWLELHLLESVFFRYGFIISEGQVGLFGRISFVFRRRSGMTIFVSVGWSRPYYQNFNQHSDFIFARNT